MRVRCALYRCDGGWY